MKTLAHVPTHYIQPVALAALVALAVSTSRVATAPAEVLFEEDFNFGFPGWTAVQPPGSFIDGPSLWHYDVERKGFVETSNYYTDAAGSSSTRRAAMLINDTATSGDFTYTARLIAGDDDGFGLIFGYQDVGTFYRISFGRQARTGWPFTGWSVDRMVDGEFTDLFGAGMLDYVQTFVNQQNLPFDVTIAVAANTLTLTIVDDPDGSPTVHNLVVGGALPGDTDGQVGIFSWGMGALGGTQVRSFLVQNPVLAPTALAGGDFNVILDDWTALITPRTDGTTNLGSGGPPLWSIGVDVNGPRNTLMENSDIFGDNSAAGTVHFAAASIVAGDPEWTNYVYSARFISSDNDGFGMLLRFADEENFYRIGLRLQNSTSGVKQGMSVQKAVGRVFTEVAWDRNTFQPPMNVPIDVHAAIKGNELRVIIVSDPGGPADTFSFGPYEITDGTVDAGKIGLFSWAQMREAPSPSRAGTEVDSVKVHSVAGEGLIVTSEFGESEPAMGVHDFTSGSSVTVSVSSSIVTNAPGVRAVLTGWAGTGSVPVSGTDASVMFELNSFSSITWQWQTEYQLNVLATAGGQVTTDPAAEWIEAGTAVTVSAEPAEGYGFVGWAGDSVSTDSPLNFNMTGPVTLTAQFQPELRILSAAIEGGNIVLEISPLPPGAMYDVQRATAVDSAWTTVATDQTASEYSEPLGTGDAFYRLVLAD